MTSSPLQPEFWDQRYHAQCTPWDFGAVPAALRDFVAARPGNGRRVLIPGCGSGYEIEVFARAGYPVSAIDFSAPAVDRARERFGHLGGDIVHGDFFAHPFPSASFDVVYERTFLCALPPERWPAIVSRCASVLRPGGEWVGFFYFGPKDDGPPFGLGRDEAVNLFATHFALVEDQPVADSLPMFAGCERWQIRRALT
jgi:SAM-dependent methyltransferase